MAFCGKALKYMYEWEYINSPELARIWKCDSKASDRIQNESPRLYHGKMRPGGGGGGTEDGTPYGTSMIKRTNIKKKIPERKPEYGIAVRKKNIMAKKYGRIKIKMELLQEHSNKLIGKERKWKFRIKLVENKKSTRRRLMKFKMERKSIQEIKECVLEKALIERKKRVQW